MIALACVVFVSAYAKTDSKEFEGSWKSPQGYSLYVGKNKKGQLVAVIYAAGGKFQYVCKSGPKEFRLYGLKPPEIGQVIYRGVMITETKMELSGKSNFGREVYTFERTYERLRPEVFEFEIPLKLEESLAQRTTTKPVTHKFGQQTPKESPDKFFERFVWTVLGYEGAEDLKRLLASDAKQGLVEFKRTLFPSGQQVDLKAGNFDPATQILKVKQLVVEHDGTKKEKSLNVCMKREKGLWKVQAITSL
jgi:hypothetical protein